MYPFPKNKDLLWPSWVLASPFGLFFRPLWVSLGGAVSLPSEYSQVFVMATGFLLATCCSDPGIIPRREAGDSVGFFWVLRNWFLGRLSSGRCTLCYVISYYVISYHIISYHIILYYIITYFLVSLQFNRP